MSYHDILFYRSFHYQSSSVLEENKSLRALGESDSRPFLDPDYCTCTSTTPSFSALVNDIAC